jgi:hypothetical protein
MKKTSDDYVGKKMNGFLTISPGRLTIAQDTADIRARNWQAVKFLQELRNLRHSTGAVYYWRIIFRSHCFESC